MALLVGIRRTHSEGIISAPSFLHHSGHALVQPLSRKGHGRDAFGVGSCRPVLFRPAHGVLTANGGNWRKGWTIRKAFPCSRSIMLFCLVKERPEDLGQLVDGGVGNEQSAGGRAGNPLVTDFRGSLGGLQKLSRIGYPSRCRCLPIPFFLFHCSLAAAFERRWHSILPTQPGDGAFTLGTVFGRLIGGIAHGPDDCALCVYAGLFLLFPRFLIWRFASL